jgi:hypothetical protein
MNCAGHENHVGQRQPTVRWLGFAVCMLTLVPCSLLLMALPHLRAHLYEGILPGEDALESGAA